MFRVQGSRRSTLQKPAAVPRRARIEGSHTFESLNSWLESDKEEEGVGVEQKKV